MKKILFAFLFISKLTYATDDWMRVTCFGSVSPVQMIENRPPKIIDFASFYFQMQPNQNVPSIPDLRSTQSERFLKISAKCWDIRMQNIDFSNFPSNFSWLDWNTDPQYTGFKLSLVSYENVCRQKGEACRQNSDCCDKKSQTCNALSLSCESLISDDQKSPPIGQDQTNMFDKRLSYF